MFIKSILINHQSISSAPASLREFSIYAVAHVINVGTPSHARNTRSLAQIQTHRHGGHKTLPSSGNKFKEELEASQTVTPSLT